MLQGEYSSFSEAAATYTKAVSQRRSVKKMFLVLSQDSQDKPVNFAKLLRTPYYIRRIES